MPKATRKSVRVTSENELQEDSNIAHESSSEDEVELQVQPSTSQIQVAQQAYMPYIEGPKMNWNVDDGLYNRFLKWKITCENILNCELAMLSESRRCKKLIAMVWRFQYSPVHFMGLSPRRFKFGSNLEKV